MDDEPYITFVIPSIGRESIKNSIESLIKQTEKNWNAIIIFDGVKNTYSFDDNRIKIIEIEKIGLSDKKSCAGFVRNIGLKNININSKWIGFLDDDDTLSAYYIENLIKEDKLNNPDIIIFRMAYDNGYILPTKYDKSIIRNKVGISFCLKTIIAKNTYFENNPYEDYIFLKKMDNLKHKIIISEKVMYFVKMNISNIILNDEVLNNINKLYPKILINF
jgi:hypothetical protein